MADDFCSGRNSISEGRESQSHLGLETEGTETLGLVLVSYKNFQFPRLVLVSYEKFSNRLVPVSSRLLQFYSVSSRSHPYLDV